MVQVATFRQIPLHLCNYPSAYPSHITQSMMSSPSYMTQLHNYCGRHGRALRYQDFRQGPLHRPTWTAVVFVDEMVYGRGEGNTMNGAREQAAARAIELIANGY